MKTPKEILKNKIREYFNNDESQISCKLRLLSDNTIELEAMLEFGKQCFEAGRIEVHNLDFEDPAFGPSLKYNNWEDYLNSLENGTK